MSCGYRLQPIEYRIHNLVGTNLKGVLVGKRPVADR